MLCRRKTVLPYPYTVHKIKIGGADEFGELWTTFLGGNFSKTEREEASDAYTDLGTNTFDDADELPVAEYLNDVSRMKSNKAAGPNGRSV